MLSERGGENARMNGLWLSLPRFASNPVIGVNKSPRGTQTGQGTSEGVARDSGGDTTEGRGGDQ